jgi:hypothetical protein
MRQAMKTDPRFERKLTRVAAFEARSRAPVDRSPALASLKALVAPEEEEKPKKIVRSRTVVSGEFLSSRGYRPVERAPEPPPRQQISREFQSRLNDMGWPGQ